LKERIVPIFEGAATATGCTVEITWQVFLCRSKRGSLKNVRGALYGDIVSNFTLADRYRDHMISDLDTNPEDMIPLDEASRKYVMNASSDMGNCTYIAPGIQALFGTNALGQIHTPPFREAAGLNFGHKEALRAWKANAFIGMDILVDDEFYEKVRGEWEPQ
jgi:hypothetical protein